MSKFVFTLFQFQTSKHHYSPPIPLGTPNRLRATAPVRTGHRDTPGGPESVWTQRKQVGSQNAARDATGGDNRRLARPQAGPFRPGSRAKVSATASHANPNLAASVSVGVGVKPGRPWDTEAGHGDEGQGRTDQREDADPEGGSRQPATLPLQREEGHAGPAELPR